MRRPLLTTPASLVLALMLVTPAGAESPGASPGSSPEASPAPVPDVQDTLPGSGVGFGGYQLPALRSNADRYTGPALPDSLDGVLLTRATRPMLRDPAIRRALLRDGFVIVPAGLNRFGAAYDRQSYTDTPVFVTTDAAYDAWHLVFDRLLRTVEYKELMPRLRTLLEGMATRAAAQVTELAGSPLADGATRVHDLLQVARAALGEDAATLSPRAQAELDLITAHDALATSPILGTDIDYSLFTPRGHYTRSKALTRYFLAMSVLGQTAFALPGAEQFAGNGADRSGMRLAALASRTLVGDRALEQAWREIYEPTAFLVGLADDYTPFELAAAIETAVPGGLADPTLLAGDEAVDAVAAALVATRPVRIDTERPSVRLMGARFVLDSWVLDQLLSPNVGTVAKQRLMPSPLDLAAVFGSRFAERTLRRTGETAYKGYDRQLRRLQAAVADRPDAAWGSTVYDAWLAALEPMWLPHGAAFPDFMRTTAWAAKDQQTGLASYAELKHDTILYVKQPVGEKGDSGPPETSPRNWVEPDPTPFWRLAAMAALARKGLERRGLLDATNRRLLREFQGLATFLARMAADELDGKPIRYAANIRLKHIGGMFEYLWFESSRSEAGEIPPADSMVAIVADLGSGRDHRTGEIRVKEIATGYIDRILVLVPDDRGRFEVAEGGVYSYYEFTQDISRRLTDEAWRAMLKAGEQPARPAWVRPIVHHLH